MTPEDLQKLLPELRALRLWHWRTAAVSRRLQIIYERHASTKDEGELEKMKADFHIKQVQALNSFFKVGDTAERDSTQ